MKEKPEFCSEAHLLFLDALRESGKTNMFGATPFLKRKFPSLSPDECSAILAYWMESFETRHP